MAAEDGANGRDAYPLAAVRRNTGAGLPLEAEFAGTTCFHLALPPDDRKARPFGGAVSETNRQRDVLGLIVSAAR